MIEIDAISHLRDRPPPSGSAPPLPHSTDTLARWLNGLDNSDLTPSQLEKPFSEQSDSQSSKVVSRGTQRAPDKPID